MSTAQASPSIPARQHGFGRTVIMGVAALVALVFMALTPAYALTLDEAKAQGLIGEMSTGYVGYPSPPSPAVQQLGDGVNLGRKASYSSIAAQQGTSLSVVEQLAGQKLVGQAPAGQYVNAGSGWQRK